MRPNRFTSAIFAASVLACSAASLAYQASTTAAAGGSNLLPPMNWTTEQDHQNMMDQLGIKALRPGPSGNENDPNHANYDESKANPYPNLPDPLVMKDGRKVTTPAMWWHERRPEIVEDFEREMYGRAPQNTPAVHWEATSTEKETNGDIPAITKKLVGHVDNSSYPAISVDIQMTLTLPANATKPAPVMIDFGFDPAFMKQMMERMKARGVNFPPPGEGMPGGPGPSWQQQLLADGWGYAILVPTSYQADNGAGLTKGIIGLCNKGQPRKPDDWGALRAWAWGASRALDYLETDPAVDAKHVGIEGVSRYGKAALVTMAFDQRFAVVLVGSSGEGGAKLSRRNFGEAVENLTGSGGYHWMAGNFLKYGASDAVFGSKNPGDLPVDAHELIALCAPRLTFISYGVPEKGDAKWLDQRGSFMATVAAGKVFRLLGAKDLGVGDDYMNAQMPPVLHGLLDGQLAWRQHDGGHTDGPNWKYFIPWADKFFGRTRPPSAAGLGGQDGSPVAKMEGTASRPPTSTHADLPVPRSDPNSQLAHSQLLQKARAGHIAVYFETDSITRRWGATDYPELLANWK